MIQTRNPPASISQVLCQSTPEHFSFSQQISASEQSQKTPRFFSVRLYSEQPLVNTLTLQTKFTNFSLWSQTLPWAPDLGSNSLQCLPHQEALLLLQLSQSNCCTQGRPGSRALPTAACRSLPKVLQWTLLTNTQIICIWSSSKQASKKIPVSPMGVQRHATDCRCTRRTVRVCEPAPRFSVTQGFLPPPSFYICFLFHIREEVKKKNQVIRN